jgi:hypothetical protein
MCGLDYNAGYMFDLINLGRRSPDQWSTFYEPYGLMHQRRGLCSRNHEPIP